MLWIHNDSFVFDGTVRRWVKPPLEGPFPTWKDEEGEVEE